MAVVMAVAVAVFGVLLVGLAVVGILRPDRVLALVRRVLGGEEGVAVAIGIRLSFAAVLLLAAPAARHPAALRFLAGVALLAALAMPLLGRERVLGMIAWWGERPPAFVRVWMGAALCFGAFLVWETL